MAVFYAPGWERAVTILKEGSTSTCFQFTLSQRHVWQLEALSLRSRIFGFAAFKNQVRHPQSTETDLVIQLNLNLKMIWSTMNSFIWKCCCSFLLKKTSDFISTWHHCSLWFGARDQTCCWLQSGQGVTLWWLRNIPLSERLWKREKRTKLKTEREPLSGLLRQYCSQLSCKWGAVDWGKHWGNGQSGRERVIEIYYSIWKHHCSSLKGRCNPGMANVYPHFPTAYLTMKRTVKWVQLKHGTSFMCPPVFFTFGDYYSTEPLHAQTALFTHPIPKI